MTSINGGIGTATVGGSSDGRQSVRITTDGVCVEETINAMERGDRGSPLSRPALEAIRSQAAEVVESIVDAYTNFVARGEVGEGGRARAADAPPQSGKSPTGLLYGRVQSGKTAAMVVSTAMAIDNGFRVFVVLTSNNLKLVKQTEKRFRVLDGALIYSSLDGSGNSYSWERDRGNIRRWMGERGVVFVCAKESGHLKALIRFLQSINAAEFPALILDDEADHATPDTQTAARSRGRPVAYSSTTFRLVVENDNPQEQGLSLRETLPHNIFLQVTATPYGLLLQSLENQLRPAFTGLLRPGNGYTGGEAFFEQAGDEAHPPLVYISEDEAGMITGDSDEVPDGLARSIAFFVLSATAHRLLTNRPPADGYKYLCHTSASQAIHLRLSHLIRCYVDGLTSHIAEDPEGVFERSEMTWAWAELEKTIGDLPEPDRVVRDLHRYLPNRSVLVVNSQEGGELDFHGRYNFIVGGNILGRGLTIDDLLVTYYLRQARVSQMDTMHQHARMYGYREGLMPFTRVFLTPTLAHRFRQIHESEKALREMLTDGASTRTVPVEVAGELRPTRSNILDVGAISAYRPGQQVYPVEPVHDPAQLGNSVDELKRMIDEAFKGDIRRNEFRRVDLDTVVRMIGTVQVQEDEGDWNSDALVRVLNSISARYGGGAYLYVRDFRPTRTILSSGAVSGPEQTQAREKDAPVLFMFYGEAGNPWDAPIVYPTVVFPTDMPAMVFNRDG